MRGACVGMGVGVQWLIPLVATSACQPCAGAYLSDSSFAVASMASWMLEGGCEGVLASFVCEGNQFAEARQCLIW